MLHAPLIVQGDHVDLEGLAFEEGIVLAGSGLSLIGSITTGTGIDVSGVNTEIAGCELSNFRGRGIHIHIHGSAQNPHVHDNYIHDGVGGGLGTAAIQLGSSMRDSSRRISARIERCRNGSTETISVKSSGNVLSGNTLIDCNNVCNRHGEDNIYQGNTLDRCYGLVVHDAGTRLIDNKIVNAARARGFSIMGGNSPWTSTVQGTHPQAFGTFLAGNSGPLIVGAKYSGHNLPAVNTTIQSHSGSIALRSEVGTTLPSEATAAPGGLKPRKRGKDTEPIATAT